jgi:hypothetical protein
MIKATIKALFGKANSFDKAVHERDNFFFVHIPKTAGTSFRKALADKYNVICDYGISSINTSAVVKENIYLQQDPYALSEILKESQSNWLCGHVPLQKYVNFVPALKTVSFVRSPLSRVLSHYNHSVSQHNFKGGLADFIKKPGVLNVQHRLLSFLHVGLVGCIGITEKYEDSLLMINQQMNTDLELKKENVNATKYLKEQDVDEQLKELILRKNHLDVKLYEEACFIHKQRLQQLKAKMPIVSAYADVNANNVVHGCAYYTDSADMVVLSVYINDKEVKQIEAKEFYRLHSYANFPRERYVGFRFPLSKDITANDSIDLFVQKTGQKINYQTLKIVKPDLTDKI